MTNRKHTNLFHEIEVTKPKKGFFTKVLWIAVAILLVWYAVMATYMFDVVTIIADLKA